VLNLFIDGADLG